MTGGGVMLYRASEDLAVLWGRRGLAGAWWCLALGQRRLVVVSSSSVLRREDTCAAGQVRGAPRDGDGRRVVGVLRSGRRGRHGARSGGLSLLYGIGGVVVYNGPAILAWLARLMAA